MHHGKCGHARAVMLAGIGNPRFPSKAVAGKTFPAFHSRRMLNPQIYVSCKRPMKMVHESLFALTKQNTPRVRYEMLVASILENANRFIIGQLSIKHLLITIRTVFSNHVKY